MPNKMAGGDLGRTATLRMRRATTVPISLFPTEVRSHIAELDTDGSGELEVGEIASAVRLMREARDSARRMRWLVVALVAVMALLVASVFGVSYAAAVMATKVKTSSGVLTDASGRAVMTAGATLSVSFVPAPSTPVSGGGGRRLFEDVAAEASAAAAGAAGMGILHARRRMVRMDAPHAHAAARSLLARASASVSTDAGAATDTNAAGEVEVGRFHAGRRMAVEDEAAASAAPKQLKQLGVIPGAVGVEICRLTLLNRYEIFLPGFDPADSGIAGFVGTLQPAQIQGCAGKDMEDLSWFGLAADFTGNMLAGQAQPSTFHVHCPPPVTAASACTVSIQLFEDAGPQVDIVALNSAAYDCPPDEEGGPSCADRRALAAAAEADPMILALREASANAEDSQDNAGGGRRLETPYKYVPNALTPSYFMNFTTRWKNHAAVYPFYSQPPLEIYPASNWQSPTRAGFPPSTANPLSFTWNGKTYDLYAQKRGTNQKDIATMSGNWTWINAIRYNDSVVASPWQNAMLACSMSFLCIAGFHPSVTAGRIFTQATWINNATGFEARLRATFVTMAANTVLTPTVLDTTLASYTKSQADIDKQAASLGRTILTAYAQCGPNEVIEMAINSANVSAVTATNWYRCKPWNDVNIALGAQEIAFGCWNSFEVLQWYFQWWQYYRYFRYKDGATVPTGATWAYPGSTDLQTNLGNYCGSVGTWKRPSTVLASYWNAGVTGHAVNVNRASATAAAPCANGRKIPVCTSQRVILNVA